MRLDLTPDHAELRTALRAFTRNKLDPIAAEMDSTGEVPDTAIPAALRNTRCCVEGSSVISAHGTVNTDYWTYFDWEYALNT